MTEETAQEYRQRVARAGGLGRAKSMTAKQRKEAATKAVEARWAKERAETKVLRDESQKLLAQARKRQAQIEARAKRLR
jgi:hypothetical protein